MKNPLLPLIAACAALALSCDRIASASMEPGVLQLSFVKNLQNPSSRAAASFPDTNSFHLNITGPEGGQVYDGTYGDAPESFSVPAGSYTVSVRSCSFTEPIFDCPQYGDTRIVSVPSGGKCGVKLSCTQLNAGIRLRADDSFVVSYPGASLILKSVDGSLMYGYSEKRTAFFNPGTIWLDLSDGGSITTLFSRILSPQEILTLNLSAADTPAGNGGGTAEDSPTAGRISISVDTSRNWTVDSFVSGGTAAGSELSSAYSVGQAKAHIGESGVWVYGYIVGGDCTSSNCSFTPPFSSDTHLLIAPKTSSADKASCLSVELRKGDIRDALNIKDHPELLGSQIFVKGDIVEKYYGIPGVKNLSDYSSKR